MLRCWRSAGREQRWSPVPDKPPRRYRPIRGADRAARAASIPASPKSASACPADRCSLHLGTNAFVAKNPGPGAPCKVVPPDGVAQSMMKPLRIALDAMGGDYG